MSCLPLASGKQATGPARLLFPKLHAASKLLNNSDLIPHSSPVPNGYWVTVETFGSSSEQKNLLFEFSSGEESPPSGLPRRVSHSNPACPSAAGDVLRPQGSGLKRAQVGSVRAAVLAGCRLVGASRSLCSGNSKRPPHRGGDGKGSARNSLPYCVFLVVPFFKF